MAKKNPTGGERDVPLDFSPAHMAILRGDLGACLDGLLGDLETPERLRNPKRSRQEADAYERLLAGLRQRKLTLPDRGARKVLKEAVAASDRMDNYTEVVANHDALHGLLAVLDGARP